LATYADAVTVNRVFTLALPDQPLFSPADQAVLLQAQQDVAAVVQAGPQAFGAQQVGTVLNASVLGINALTRVPCQRFVSLLEPAASLPYAGRHHAALAGVRSRSQRRGLRHSGLDDPRAGPTARRASRSGRSGLLDERRA
jgi:hypothetical protein